MLCARARGDGTISTTLKVRDACRPKETQIELTALGLPPGTPEVTARVYGSADVAVPSDVLVFLAFDVERWDTADLHDMSAPTRLTAPVAGVYQMDCRGSWKTAGGGWRNMTLRLNGELFIAIDTQEGSAAHHTETAASTQWRLAAGDYIECGASQVPVSPAIIATNPPGLATTLEFSMTRVGP